MHYLSFPAVYAMVKHTYRLESIDQHLVFLPPV